MGLLQPLLPDTVKATAWFLSQELREASARIKRGTVA